MWCPPQGHLQPHPCELGEVLAPLSQLLPPSHPHGSGCSLCQLRGGGVTAKAPRGTGVVPPFKNSSSFPPFQSPVSQKQRGSVQRCCAPSVHPVMVWEAGMFCCHQKPALLQSSAPARCLPAVVLWGILQHSLGWGTKIPYSGFTAVCLALGQNWAQCGVPSAPSLECVGSSAVSPPRDSLCPLLPGCSCLAGGTEEHSAAAGL